MEMELQGFVTNIFKHKHHLLISDCATDHPNKMSMVHLTNNRCLSLELIQLSCKTLVSFQHFDRDFPAIGQVSLVNKPETAFSQDVFFGKIVGSGRELLIGEIEV